MSESPTTITAKGIDRTTKISLGLVVSALVVVIGVLQPLVSQGIASLLDRREFETETKMRIVANEEAVDELRDNDKKQLASLHRIEVRLGTVREGDAP
ncbi:MAG: hypothetical protein AAGI54_04150 [Planctomycetota bacterium]